MILWLDGRHDPGENMRRDRALLAAAEAGAPPMLRLFGFVPHGITLGLNQVPERELDLERCTGDAIPWSVRPTGGRAIFHAEEWTYALATPIDDPEWGGSRAQTYARIARLLVASLVRLGVPAELVAGSTGAPLPRSSAGGVAPPCFASSVRHEVALGGRKLVGSAQRRTARALLQQGSLLLGDGHLRLADYLAVPEERREAVREALRMTATSAGAAIGPDVPLERWGDALATELGPGIRRLDGAAGAFLLTLSKPDSYTSAAFEACS